MAVLPLMPLCPLSAELEEGLRSGTPLRRFREKARFLFDFFLAGGASGTSSGVGVGSREFMVDKIGCEMVAKQKRE